ERALTETERRRAIQIAYNEKHGVQPMTIKKEVYETVRSHDMVAEVRSQYSAETEKALADSGEDLRLEDIPVLINGLERRMKDHAKAMEFEKAAEVRDEIAALRKMMGVSEGRIGVDKRKMRRAKPDYR
ncbi:MAG: UvrB/UvrC motif-containing protein, partial [Fimbriimonadaceae bacterium]|nr:UvrB/UvrC motif-containing protein [Fimbriimonadaceae bacterium]